jgi:hypothetical protein
VLCNNTITSINLTTVCKSLDSYALLSSDITYASVSDKKLIKSSFNAGHDSGMVNFICDIISHLFQYIEGGRFR